MPGVLLAVDEEGGDVTRLHYPAVSTAVGNAVLGRLDDPATTRAVAAGIGHELTALGIGLDLAPDVDVNSSPDNPVIGVRSFGDDPALVARHAAAWVEGLQSTGVAACAKHFPGHGDTVVDSHHGLPRVEVTLEVLRERELAPFRAGVDAGVVVSDVLDMAVASADTGIPEAAVPARVAGVDLLCLGSGTTPETYDAVHTAIVSAVHAGRLPQQRVTGAAARVRSLASATAQRMPRPGIRTDVTSATLPDETVARAFRVSDAARAWLGSPAPLAVVQVGSTANLAVGGVSWGPAALGATVTATAVPAG